MDWHLKTIIWDSLQIYLGLQRNGDILGFENKLYLSNIFIFEQKNQI